jgi:lysyl-tRNA synthetase class 2
MLMTNQRSIQEVLFFPQMKLETFSAEEKLGPELNENEQLIFDILSKASPVELSVLKDAAGLSNKQWDKGIKGLNKHGLTKVTKTDDALLVDLIG